MKEKDRITVLFIIKNLEVGGAARATLNLLRYINKKKFETVLFLTENKVDLWNEIPSDVKVVCPHMLVKYRKYLFPYYFLKLLQFAFKADIVIGAMEHSPTYLAYMAGLLTKTPAVGWIRIVHEKAFRGAPIRKRISNFVYRRLQSVVFVSEAAAGAANLKDVKKDQLKVLCSPYDINLVVKKSNEPCLEWYLEVTRKPTLITVGRLVAPKGLNFLIRAHKEVLREGIEHNLVICGEGYLRDELEKIVLDLGVSSSVFLPGYIANPFPLVKNATAFVLSSLHEGHPGVVIESLVLGTPVVSTTCQAARDILCDGRYGIMVKPGDVRSLATGMRDILVDSDLRKELSNKGLERAKWFSPEERVPPWERHLLQVVKRYAEHT